MTDEVGDGDGVGDVVDERSVTAVGDRPLGAEHGGRAVAAARAEFAVGAGVEQLERATRGCARSLVARWCGAVQRAYEGAPWNALSTSVSVVTPLSAPRPVCESLKIAPPKMPCSVLCLPTEATSSSDPLSASISVPVRIWIAPVSGTNAPDGDLMNTVPVTGVAFSLVPSTGAGGAAAAGS